MPFFSDETLYQIELFWGVLNVAFSLLGLYFVYRWGVTLLSTDDEVRKILMGEPFHTWFSSDDKVILWFAAAYLGFKLLYIVISTARWEINMEHTRNRLFSVRSARQSASRAKTAQIRADITPDANRTQSGAGQYAS